MRVALRIPLIACLLLLAATHGRAQTLEVEATAEEEVQVVEEAAETAEGEVAEEQAEPPQLIGLRLWVVQLKPSTPRSVYAQVATPFSSVEEVTLGIDRLEQAGHVSRSRVLSITLTNGTRSVQRLEVQQPSVQAVNMDSRGRRSAIQFRDTGAVFQAKPKLGANQMIEVEFEYEESYVEPTDVAMYQGEDGEEVNVDRTRQVQQSSTVTCRDGGVTLVSSTWANKEAEQPGMLMFLEAKIVSE